MSGTRPNLAWTSGDRSRWCDACRHGNHRAHKPAWAYVCVGCLCDWLPADHDLEDGAA